MIFALMLCSAWVCGAAFISMTHGQFKKHKTGDVVFVQGLGTKFHYQNVVCVCIRCSYQKRRGNIKVMPYSLKFFLETIPLLFCVPLLDAMARRKQVNGEIGDLIKLNILKKVKVSHVGTTCEQNLADAEAGRNHTRRVRIVLQLFFKTRAKTIYL